MHCACIAVQSMHTEKIDDIAEHNNGALSSRPILSTDIRSYPIKYRFLSKIAFHDISILYKSNG